MTMIERTLVLLKPDAVKRGIMGRIISRFEDAGLKVVGAKMIQIDETFAKKLGECAAIYGANCK